MVSLLDRFIGSVRGFSDLIAAGAAILEEGIAKRMTRLPWTVVYRGPW